MNVRVRISVPGSVDVMGTRGRACAFALIAGALLAACGQTAATQDPVAPQPSSVQDQPFDDVSVAAREAARTGRPVELTKLRDGGARTFIRPDGQTLIERTAPDGTVSHEVRNTPPSVNHDQRQQPMACGGGGAPMVTTLTPTLSVTVSDVDHRAHGDQVRVLFEVWPLSANDDFSNYERLKPDNAVARGTSRWLPPDRRASWTVPAGLLQEGRDYLWRARAEDGATVSGYASWYWQLFAIDTSQSPDAQPCSGDRFDMITTDRVGAALEAMAEAHPDLYACAYVDIDQGPVVCALPRAGLSDEETLAATRAEAERAIMTTTDDTVGEGYLTDEYKRELVAALTVRLGRE